MKIELRPITSGKGLFKKQLDAARQNVLEEVREKVTGLMENVECPDHHERPHRVTLSIDPDRKPPLKIDEIEGCCEKLREEANEVLATVRFQ